MKLIYRLERWGNAVVFQVVAMDERFRSNQGKGQVKYFKSTNGMRIKSFTSPLLEYDEVYLRGYNSSGDEYVSSLQFKDKKEAEEYIEKVHDALADWSDNWDGWIDKEVIDINDGRVFTV